MKFSDSLPICLNKNQRKGCFDKIIVGRFTRISFHRTLRIPEDGNEYPLPAGLGTFPVHRVEDYADKVPEKWLEEGGFFIPLYQKEALFIQFEGTKWHPTIAKVCIGGINAITGKTYSENLSASQQDYVVIPDQKWLDGIVSEYGAVSQFVAMPLGQGYTIEAQMTDEENFGGFQIVVFDAKPGRFPERDPDIAERMKNEHQQCLYAAPLSSVKYELDMGIAAGGIIKQQIQPDVYGSDTWDQKIKRGITIHLVNSLAYKEITGEDAPSSPITSLEYQNAKIPWYSHYDETITSVKPPSLFKRIKNISSIEVNRGMKNKNKEKITITPEIIRKIRTPERSDAVENHRMRAKKASEGNLWVTAIYNISLAIDLNTHVKSDDYALRSLCNFHLKNYADGIIDASTALRYDPDNFDAVSSRASCRALLGDYDGLLEDADLLMTQPEYEEQGREFRAQAIEFGESVSSIKVEYQDENGSKMVKSDSNIYNLNDECNYTTGIPQERLLKLVNAAYTLINEGVKNPRDIAIELDELAAREGKPKKLRKYSAALWYACKAIDPNLPDPVSWQAIYNDIDAECK